MIHHLKIWPHYFSAVVAGQMRFQYRYDKDRNFKLDDVLILQEFDRTTLEYTGWQITAHVTFVMPIGDDMVILSIEVPTKMHRTAP